MSKVRAGPGTKQVTDALCYSPSLPKEDEKGSEGETFVDWKTTTSLMHIIIIKLNICRYIQNQY